MPLLVSLTGWRGRPGELPGQPPLRAFALGLTTGTAYFVGTIYWTGTVLVAFGDLHPALAMIAMLLLSLYLAIYPALTALITSRLVARAGARRPVLRTRRVGGHRVRAGLCVRRISVGAAW